MASGSRQQAGTSDPLDFRVARAVGVPNNADFALYGGNIGTNLPGSSFLNTVAQKAEVAIAGALKVRIRGLANAAGVLHFDYLRPAAIRNTDPSGTGYKYGVNPPVDDFDVVANAEFSIDIMPVGESDLLVTFTPGADGVWTFLDVMQQ